MCDSRSVLPAKMEHHQILAEDIALLFMVDRIPEPPSRNTPPATILQAKAENRTLTLKQECDIVEALAFICATSDDHEKVTAVCVEEHSEDVGMTVIMAANTGDLEAVKKGLESLFQILRGVSHKSMS
jgi:hypothetical protein